MKNTSVKISFKKQVKITNMKPVQTPLGLFLLEGVADQIYNDKSFVCLVYKEFLSVTIFEFYSQF